MILGCWRSTDRDLMTLETSSCLLLVLFLQCMTWRVPFCIKCSLVVGQCLGRSQHQKVEVWYEAVT
jgi:hypothetical protein